MKILHNIMNKLVEDGAKVRVLARGTESNELNRLGVEYIEGSILDQRIVAKVKS
jgi:nucleoside-diphosphate-sugar epimerase